MDGAAPTPPIGPGAMVFAHLARIDAGEALLHHRRPVSIRSAGSFAPPRHAGFEGGALHGLRHALHNFSVEHTGHDVLGA